MRHLAGQTAPATATAIVDARVATEAGRCLDVPVALLVPPRSRRSLRPRLRWSRRPPVVVTAGDHRTVCCPQPAAADRRPPARGVAPPRTGAAAWRRGFGDVDRKRPHCFRARGEVRRGGISGLQLRREGRGRRRATRARRFGVLRCLDVRACDFHRACASAGHGARARQRAPLTARMMGHGLGLAAQHYAERDGLKGAALRPAGGGISW